MGVPFRRNSRTGDGRGNGNGNWMDFTDVPSGIATTKARVMVHVVQRDLDRWGGAMVGAKVNTETNCF